LLNAFPADHIVEETKKPFWSGLKRVPTPLELDLNDPIHAELIQAGANIYATMFNIPMEKDKARVAEAAKKVAPIPFVSRNVKIETEEKKAAEQAPIVTEDDEKEVENLLEELKALSIDASKAPQCVEFEKDDPSNFHIEFMAGVSNLRVLLILRRPETIKSRKSTTSR
jgi:ubiquitin-activating enzyme E1